MTSAAYHFNPFSNSRSEVLAFLRGLSNDRGDEATPCHSHSENGKRLLLRLLNNGNIQQEDITGKEATFLDSVSVNDAAAQVSNNMETYRNNLGAICDYEVNVVTPGQTLEIPFSAGKIHLFCVTKKLGGQYFDLVVHAKKRGESDWRSLNYTQSSQPVGMTHSGDVGQLLHYVHFLDHLPNDSVATINVVGYQRTPLRTFTNQLPTILIVDHITQVLYLVPCPLDERTMGNKTMAALCGFRRCQGILELHALESPEGLDNKDTTDMDRQTSNMATTAAVRVKSAIGATKAQDRLETERNAQRNVEAGQASMADAFALLGRTAHKQDDEKKEADNQDVSVPWLSQYVLVESGLDYRQILSPTHHLSDGSTVVATTGAGMVRLTSDTLESSAIKMDPTGVDLPLGMSSEFQGSPALALGLPAKGFPYDFTSASFRKMLERAGLLVAHISGKGSEKTLSDACERANAIFILHGALGSSTSVSPEAFNEIDVTGFTTRRGPCSVLLIQSSDGRRFFYSAGSLVPGLLDYVPEFGADVTEIMTDERIRDAANEFKVDPSKRPFPNLVAKKDLMAPLDNRTVILGSRSMTLAEFEEYLSNDVTIEGLEKDVGALTCALTQIASVLSTGELKPVRERLSKSLQVIVDRYTAPLKAKKMELLRLVKDSVGAGQYASIANDEQGKMARQKIIADLKAASRFAGRVLSPLVHQVAGMVSVLRSSRRKLDLARVQKLDKMKSNIDAIRNMDWDTLSDRLLCLCAESGFIFATVDPEVNQSMLVGVTNGSFVSSTLLSRPMPEVLHLDPRMSFALDACTSTCLSEVAAGQRHDLAGPAHCITIPASTDGFLADWMWCKRPSQVGLPLLDKDICLEDPSLVFWPSTPEGDGGCNDPDRALTRYLVQQIFIASERGRSLNMQAHENSVELAFYCAHFVMSTVERLVATLSDSQYPVIAGPESPQWNDSTRVILRGLYGLMLSFLASGADPASNIWCVVQRGSKMPLPKAGKGEWVLLARFIQQFPHSCWPVGTVKRNCKTLITRLVKAVADAFLQPMRDSLNETKKLEAQEYYKKRNHELHVAYFCASLVRRYRQDPPPLELVERVVPEILKMLGHGSESDGRSRLEAYHLHGHHRGFVIVLDALLKYIAQKSISPDRYAATLQVAEFMWKKRDKNHWHVPGYDGPHQQSLRDEVKAIVAGWEQQVEELISWEVVGENENIDGDGDVVAATVAGAETPRDSQLMLAIGGKPGSARGALALAQMIDRDGCVEVKGLLKAYNRVTTTAAGASIRAPAVCSILEYLGFVSEADQGKLVADLLAVFLIGWRGNSDVVWDQALEVWKAARHAN